MAKVKNIWNFWLSLPTLPLVIAGAFLNDIFYTISLLPVKMFSWFYYYILDTIYFDVGTKNPKIVVDDYDFNMARKTPNKTVWICSGYYKTKCKTRATTSGRMVYINGIHNHEPKQKKSKFKNMLSQHVTIVRTNV